MANRDTGAIGTRACSARSRIVESFIKGSFKSCNSVMEPTASLRSPAVARRCRDLWLPGRDHATATAIERPLSPARGGLRDGFLKWGDWPELAAYGLIAVQWL